MDTVASVSSSQSSVENCVTIGASLEVTYSLTKCSSPLCGVTFFMPHRECMVVLSSLRNAQLCDSEKGSKNTKNATSFANRNRVTLSYLWSDK